MAIVELSDEQKAWYILKGYEIREYTGSTRRWFLNNKLHREDGPAVEHAGGSVAWFLNGKRHREDGPAYEGATGTRYWYLNDKLMSEEEFNKISG